MGGNIVTVVTIVTGCLGEVAMREGDLMTKGVAGGPVHGVFGVAASGGGTVQGEVAVASGGGPVHGAASGGGDLGVGQDWQRAGTYHWQGPGGTQVSACQVAGGTGLAGGLGLAGGPCLAGGEREGLAEKVRSVEKPAVIWKFTAWGAVALPEMNYWQWRSATSHQTVYARGQETPQRRPWLGVYSTAEAARAACLAWLAGWNEAVTVNDEEVAA